MKENQIEIRTGTIEDVAVITDLIRNMVLEMENYSGHRVDKSNSVWIAMEKNVRSNIYSIEHIFLIAYHESQKDDVIGMVSADIEPLDSIFVEKKRLHLSAVYVEPNARRKGVAEQLIGKMLEWGQQMNVEEVDLNVLVSNPAKQLYEKLGFKPNEISLVKKMGK
ncbi:GNAT family N-acetyltransferase [candidate division WOR-3 bacterium]|nr:GNAT family N-acetyltransferase [candidate division WOR-3 bacterium]